MTMFARLDKKTGYRVLCGRIDCPGEIARVNESRQALHFGDGWTNSVGAWHLSAHARGGLQQGRSPSHRRRWSTAEPAMPARSATYDLPAPAVCPTCQLVQVLDPERLCLVQHA